MSLKTVDGMRYIELNDDSPSMNQPTDIKIRMKDHQLTMLARCIRTESDQFVTTANLNIRSSMGIICDSVGSGKSLIALALISIPLNENIRK